jgi:hypothetical protein
MTLQLAVAQETGNTDSTITQPNVVNTMPLPSPIMPHPVCIKKLEFILITFKIKNNIRYVFLKCYFKRMIAIGLDRGQFA